MTSTPPLGDPTDQPSPLRRALAAIDQLQAKLARAEHARSEPIAVVGMGCRIPGAASPDEFWELLCHGADAVREVPSDRWDVDSLYDPDPDAPGKMSTRHGGFIDDVGMFDAGFFGIAPREAVSMDPQHRLLLEVTWEALEQGAIAPHRLAGSRTGVFIGMTTSDYAQVQLDAAGVEGLDAYRASGIAHSVASGRISYVLGLEGPSLTIDTACSSSLVAVHLAIQSLRAGECTTAIAGGVNLILSPDNSITLSKYHMMAPDGRCKTFDAAADGFVRGEGCGVVVLKPLRDALAAGDPVQAVIRGSAVNQDGQSSGLTAPNGPSQEAVIRDAWANADVTPAEVGYVEAHGTGTALGDPIEVQALAAVLGRERSDGAPLAIGSVKTNVGHLEAAAGVTGLIKAILVVQHGEVPPHLHLVRPSPHIDWAAMPIVVPTEATSLPEGERIAGVSSFGFSGTNAHVVVAAPPGRDPVEPVDVRTTRVLPLSARSATVLRSQAGRLAEWLRVHPSAQLEDVCLTTGSGRAHFSHRLCVAADDPAQMIDRLTAAAAGESPVGRVTSGEASRADPAKIAFLFTGQGSQYVGMARSLYAAEPIFREALDRVAAAVDACTDGSLLDVVFAADDDAATAALTGTGWAQPALFAIECALVELWRAWGVDPQVLLGHSVGEYVAAVVAGVFSLEDAARLIAARGRLMQALPSGGAMSAVFAPLDEVMPVIEQVDGLISVAAVNGPANTVVSGERDAVDAVRSAFAERGVRVQDLTVSHAFHSPLMRPMLDEFERVASSVTYHAPTRRVISNVTGEPIGRELAEAAYWVRHIMAPVQFESGVQSLGRLGVDVVVEIGPHPVLTAMAQECWPRGSVTWASSLRRDRDDLQHLTDALAALSVAGVDVDWSGVYGDRGRRRAGLPTYPFDRQHYWVDVRRRPRSGANATTHRLLGSRIRSVLRDVQYEQVLDADTVDFVHDHRVVGTSIMPATGFIEMAISGAASLGELTDVADMEILAPLWFPTDRGRVIQTVVTPAGEGDATFEIHSQLEESDRWQLHARGRVVARSGLQAQADDLATVSARCPQSIGADEHYERLRSRGLDFGPSLRGIVELRRGDAEVLATIGLAAEAGAYASHPATLDACLQTFAWLAPDDADLYLPFAIDEVSLATPLPRRVTAHARMEANGPRPVGDVHLFDEAGVLVGALRGVRFVATSPDALRHLGGDDISEWFYDLDWHREGESAGERSTVDAVALVEAVSESVPELVEQYDLGHQQRLQDALHDLSGRYVVRALDRLGADLSPGATFSSAELPVVATHRPLVDRLLGGLAAEGFLRVDGDRWQVVAQLDLDDPGPELARLAEQHPDGSGEITITARCGAGLAGALDGSTDPLELLFPNGTSVDAERMYRDSPLASFYNSIAADVVMRAVEQRRGHRPPRVIEVGAGTGGTTAHVLRRALDGDFEYTFTDVSPLFVERARESLSGYPAMEFRTLDIEQDPTAQGFASHDYDVVIAANVLHATSDLARTLEHVGRLLAPGGVLVLVEMTRPARFIDISFGLTPGWWSFADDVRDDYVLMDRDRWVEVLVDAGFGTVAAAPGLDHGWPADLSVQTVLVASSPTVDERRRRWLVLSDRAGVGSRFAEIARAEGHEVVVAEQAADGVLSNDSDTWHVDPCDPGHLSELVGSSDWDEVVHLWSAAADRSPTDDQQVRVGSALSVVQSLVALGASPRMTLVTHGGHALIGDAADPGQATMWGLGRTIVIEHPELRCTCVDLDPAPAHDPAASLWAELARDRADDQVVWRHGARYTPRLRRRADVARAVGEPDAQRLELAADGVLDHMKMVRVERVPPRAGEVEIAVRAAALNFRDVMNALSMRDDTEPVGSECAGVISAVGDAVDDFAVGDAVIAVAPGCFGSFVTLGTELVVPKPPHLTFAEAAGIPLAYLTAHDALHRQAKLEPGERVLVHAAAGGVGLAAVELARRAGADVVATAGSEHKRSYLREMGIELVGDSRSGSFVDEITRNLGEVDVVINSLTGPMLTGSFEVLAASGRFVELGKREVLSDTDVRALRSDVSYHTVPLAEDLIDRPAEVGVVLRSIVERVAAGDLRLLPVQQFSFGAIDEAFRYMAQARHIGKIVLVPERDGASCAVPAPKVRPDAAYLITGGLSGLGLLVAQRLVERGARSLALVGRSAPDDDARTVIERMERAGATVLVCRADVAVRDDVAAAVRRVADELPPLRGVFHAAGVLDDGAMVRQDWERFATVFGPKVDGSWHLHELTRDCDLDLFVLFSSVAALFGSAGQSNHSAANRFMDALAADRRACGAPGLSINWGAWADVGAAVATEARSDRRGIEPMDPAVALEALEQAIEHGISNVAIAAFDWQAYFDRAAGEAVPAWLSDIAVDHRRAPASASSPAVAGVDVAALLILDPDRRHQVLLDFVAEQVARVLGSSSSIVVSEQQPLSEMGLDSLMAVELRNALGAGLGLADPLPAVLVFDYPTVDALAGYLSGVLLGEQVEEDAGSGTLSSVGRASADDLLAALDEIDDDELDRLLGGASESERPG